MNIAKEVRGKDSREIFGIYLMIQFPNYSIAKFEYLLFICSVSSLWNKKGLIRLIRLIKEGDI